MSEVSKFIDEDHGPVESTGEFTLSPAKAREKLARYLLESTSDCLLRLVQAAVLDQANSISITISRYGFKLLANGATGPAPGELEELNADRLLSDRVSQAVHSLVLAGAEVIYERTTGGLQRITLPSQLLEAKTSNKEEPRWSVEATFKRSFFNSLVDGLKDRAAFHRALHRCRFSPVPITLGRRDIIDPYPDRATRPFFQKPIGGCLVSRNFSLYERYEIQSGATHEGFRCVPGSERQAFARMPEDATAPTLNGAFGAFKNPSLQAAVLFHETVGGEGGLCRRAIRIPVYLQGDGQLTVIHGGVTLEPVEFNFGCPGVEIIESLGDLKTDLSGLRLVRDDALDRRRSQLTELIANGLQKIQDSRWRLPRFTTRGSNVCHLQRYIDDHLATSLI